MLFKLIKENLDKIIITLICAIVLSASGAIIGVRINDKVQDSKIDTILDKVNRIENYLLENRR